MITEIAVIFILFTSYGHVTTLEFIDQSSCEAFRQGLIKQQISENITKNSYCISVDSKNRR